MTVTAAGTMRHRVTIQSRTTAIGSRGQSTEAWSNIDSRWASVVELSGNESEEVRKIVATATTRIRMRKPLSYTLTTKHRIKFNDETYTVGSITPQGEDRDDIDVICTRNV